MEVMCDGHLMSPHGLCHKSGQQYKQFCFFMQNACVAWNWGQWEGQCPHKDISDLILWCFSQDLQQVILEQTVTLAGETSLGISLKFQC